MRFVDLCNRLAEFWSQYMHDALFHGSMALIIAALLWFVIRKKASVQFGYALFLLVLLKFVVHVEIPVPTWRTGASLLNIQTSTQSAILSNDRQITTHSEQQNADPLHDQSAPTDATPSSMQSISPPTEKSSPALEQISAERESSLTLQSWLMILWLSMVMALLGWFVKSQKRMRDMVRLSRGIDPGGLPFDWDRLKKNLRIRKSVHLLTNSKAPLPVVVGVFKPRIILPQDFFRRHTPNQMQWILSHELAHIRRNDLAVSFVQRILQIIYFFHPAVWITNRIAAQLREYACDDLALAACQGSRREYGEGLLNLVEQMNGWPIYTAAPLGLVSHKSQIRRRIMRIVDSKRNIRVNLTMSSITILLFFSLCFLPTFIPTEWNENSARAETEDIAKIQDVENNTISKSNPLATTQVSKQINIGDAYPLTESYFRVSPDGKRLAIYDWNDALLLIDTRSSKVNVIEPDIDRRRNYAWSPDSKQLVYNKWSEDKEPLVLKDIETGNTTILLEDSNLILYDWSPDGQFLLCMMQNDNQNLFLLSITTKTIDKVNCNLDQYQLASPCFSPDGKYIAYKAQNASESLIHIHSLDGAKHTHLFKEYGKVDHPIWSSDGNVLLYRNNMHGKEDLYGISIKDGNPDGYPFLIKSNIENEIYTKMTRDGKLPYMVNFSEASSGAFLLPMDLETGKLNGIIRRLSRGVGPGTEWSPDGQRIFQLHWQRNGSSYVYLAESGEVLDEYHHNQFWWWGRGLSWLKERDSILTCINNEFSEYDLIEKIFKPVYKNNTLKNINSLSVSADNKTVCFVANRDIYVMDLEEKNPKMIYTNKEQGAFYYRPVISPNGKYVAFIKGNNNNNTNSICEISIDGERQRDIVFQPESKADFNIFDWSPDGRYIAMILSTQENSKNQLWIFSAKTGESFQIKLPNQLAEPFFPRWSPDGKWISIYCFGLSDQFWFMENFLPKN